MTDIDEAPLAGLPRELADISVAVREVGAPPTPILAEPYRVRLADADDAEMLSEWMNRPHLAKAWEYAWPPSRWHDYLRAQLAGEYSRPLICDFRGKPFAYIELYRAAKDSIGPRYDADPHDIGLHGDRRSAFRQPWHRPDLLPRLVASIFELEPQCRRIMFDPDHRNTGARVVCEHAGCAFLGEHDMSNRRMALYVLPRTPQDVPAG
jgi:RimJ/RimL family protein N-acetyltransferase